MVLFLTVVLGVSIVGLFSIITIKRYEMRTGRVVLADVRPAVGHWLGSGLHFVEHHLPRFVWLKLEQAWRYLNRVAHRLVAWGVLHTERGLERTLETLRQRTDVVPHNKEASAFLREVAEHKKSILEGDPDGKRAIYEE